MKNIDKWLCVAFIAYFTVAAAGVVGDIPTNSEQFTWDLVLKVFSIMAIPAWLGYEAGKKDERAS